MNYNQHVQSLRDGKTVKFRPKGQSMRPRIESGQLITVEPITTVLKEGDIAFCKVNGNFYVHLVKAVAQNGSYQISNNRGRVNGWTKAVYGVVTKIEP